MEGRKCYFPNHQILPKQSLITRHTRLSLKARQAIQNETGISNICSSGAAIVHRNQSKLDWIRSEIDYQTWTSVSQGPFVPHQRMIHSCPVLSPVVEIHLYSSYSSVSFLVTSLLSFPTCYDNSSLLHFLCLHLGCLQTYHHTTTTAPMPLVLL